VEEHEMDGACFTNGREEYAYRLLVGKPAGKRPLGRPRLRWVDNIRMGLGEVGWGDVGWIGMAQDRNRWRALVNSVMNLRFLKMPGNYRVAPQLAVYRVMLSSIELVSWLVSLVSILLKSLLSDHFLQQYVLSLSHRCVNINSA
jgi:hypothetical protein